jgi:hypothetical protein
MRQNRADFVDIQDRHGSAIIARNLVAHAF